MGFHTFPSERAAELEDESRYRFCSRDELLSLIAPHEDMTIADLGSGTGFFADDVAPHVRTLYAVDVQPPMHEFYRSKGLPETVRTVVGEIENLPFARDALDAAYSVDTYHEYANEESLAELARVIRPGGRVTTVDWSASGNAVSGPPLTERFDLETAIGHFTDAGFAIEQAHERPETYVCVARK